AIPLLAVAILVGGTAIAIAFGPMLDAGRGSDAMIVDLVPRAFGTLTFRTTFTVVRATLRSDIWRPPAGILIAGIRTGWRRWRWRGWLATFFVFFARVSPMVIRCLILL